MARVEHGLPEYAALLAAFDTSKPACDGDDQFIRDREELSKEQVHRLRSICATCPLYAPCNAYAASAKPRAGFWAGDHGTRSRNSHVSGGAE